MKNSTFEHQETVCSICCEAMPGLGGTLTLECKHKFHPHCISRWFAHSQLSKTCPNCRALGIVSKTELQLQIRDCLDKWGCIANTIELKLDVFLTWWKKHERDKPWYALTAFVNSGQHELLLEHLEDEMIYMVCTDRFKRLKGNMYKYVW